MSSQESELQPFNGQSHSKLKYTSCDLISQLFNYVEVAFDVREERNDLELLQIGRTCVAGVPKN